MALIAFCGRARAEPLTHPLTPAAFTQELVRALTTALPSATVTIKRDLELAIRHADGGTASVDLTNAYRTYSGDPLRLGEVIRVYVAALSGPPQAQTATAAKVDRSRIVPVIKTWQWIAELHNGLKASGSDQQHLFEDFSGELAVVYAEDSDKRMRYLTTTEDIGVERNVTITVKPVAENSAVPCSPQLSDLLARAVEDAGLEVLRLPSGAGHDGVVLSSLTDFAMLFVRCKGGVSHHPAESVTVDDVRIAIDVLARFLERLAAA